MIRIGPYLPPAPRPVWAYRIGRRPVTPPRPPTLTTAGWLRARGRARTRPNTQQENIAFARRWDARVKAAKQPGHPAK